MDVATVALLFYAAGHCCSESTTRYLQTTSKMQCLAVALGAFVLTVILDVINGPVNLFELSFGKYPILFVPCAVAGIVSVLFISVVVRASDVSRWLGKNTIIIFPVHALMFSVFTGIAVTVFGFPYDFKESSLFYGFTYSALALILSYPTAWILYRLFPFVFGKRVLA
jgi:acyltransferase